MQKKKFYTEEQLELQEYIPPAMKQTSLLPEEIINSSNCGVIIQRSGQVTNEFRNEARIFAMEVCEHTNTAQKGFINSFLFEETYGQQDRIHWFIHLRRLEDYMRFHRMAQHDPGFGEIFMRNRAPENPLGGDWKTLFIGEFQERLLIPHFWGANGTHSAFPIPEAEKRLAIHQTTQTKEQVLHSANSRMVIMRQAQIDMKHRSEARVFARAYADYLNKNLAGYVTCFVYEEHFGEFDRLHWLLHLESYEDYQYFNAFLAEDAGIKELLNRNWIEGSHTDWSALFLAGSVNELLLCPQHPTKDF